MEEIKFGLYAICKTNELDDEGDIGDRFYDFGFPFVAVDDRAACGMVKNTMEKHDNIPDLDSFYLYRLGDYVTSFAVPFIPCISVVDRCDHILGKVVSDCE